MKYRMLLGTLSQESTNEEERSFAMQRLLLATGVVDAVVAANEAKLCSMFTKDEVLRMVLSRWSTWFDGREFIEGPGAIYPNIIAFELEEAVKYGELAEDARDKETMRKLASLQQFESLALNFILLDVRDDFGANKGLDEWSYKFLDGDSDDLKV